MTKILLVLTRPPYPAVDGTRERILNEIGDLTKDFEVDLLIIGNEKISDNQVNYLKGIGVYSIVNFYIPKIQSYLYSLTAIFSNKPLQASYFFHPLGLNWLFRNTPKYQAIHFHTLRFGRYLTKLKKSSLTLPRLLLCFNDAISLNYLDAAKKAKGLWRYIYRLETKRVSDYETEMLDLADGFSIVSERDKDYLLNLWRKKNKGKQEPIITVIRHGINDDLFHYNYSPTSNNLVFIGNLLYPPNRQGLDFFCNEILPGIASKQEVKLIIMGKGSREYFSSRPNCEPLGFVDNPYPVLTSQALFVSPADFGAGVPTKSLLAMSLGLPVVSTITNAKGIEGIIDGENIILIDYNNPGQAIETIDKALNDGDLRRRIGRAGKDLAFKNYRQSENYPLLKRFIQGN